MHQLKANRFSAGKLRRKFIFSAFLALIILAGLILYQSETNHNGVEAGTCQRHRNRPLRLGICGARQGDVGGANGCL